MVYNIIASQLQIITSTCVPFSTGESTMCIYHVQLEMIKIEERDMLLEQKNPTTTVQLVTVRLAK